MYTYHPTPNKNQRANKKHGNTARACLNTINGSVSVTKLCVRQHVNAGLAFPVPQNTQYSFTDFRQSGFRR